MFLYKTFPFYKKHKEAPTKNKAVVLNLVVPLMIFGLLGSLNAALFSFCQDETKTKEELTIWSVFDDSDVFTPLINDFNKTYKNIKINYYKKPVETYENDLINALAAGRGPDIFAIHNTWLPKHIDKLAPMPENLMTVSQFRDAFVDVAIKDFVSSPPGAGSSAERIYAVPLYVDTLALYWNRDIFNSVNIAQPPQDWKEFGDDVQKLVKKDESNNITQAGVAFGTAKNINLATDILGLLMLQTGAKMVSDEKDEATFDQSVSAQGQRFQPGENSLQFYTDFANPIKKVYTWNDKMDYSIDAFVEGRAAMMLNYAYHMSTIRAKEPHLRFAVAAAPQPENAQLIVNYANYWGLGVSDSSTAQKQKFAWIFNNWFTQQTQAQKYAEAAKRPVARRDLVAWQQDDLDLGVFAKQSLSARSWYEADSPAIETIFSEMISSVVSGRSLIAGAVIQAAKQVTLLMQK